MARTRASEGIPLGREELLQALRRAEIMTSEKSNSVKMTFTKNNLAITANTPDVGEARERRRWESNPFPRHEKTMSYH